MRLVLTLCLALFSTTEAIACSFPPREASVSPFELVLGATSIVLATAASKSETDGGERSDFVFESKEVLKGEVPKQFTYNGFVRTEDFGVAADYNAHTDPRFWAYSSGNSSITSWCGIFGVFEVGQTYLIIATEKGHFKAYENIRIRLLAEDFR